MKELPLSEPNRAGRTMPVKFSVRTSQDVDPAQPFVYSESLEIKVLDSDGDVVETYRYGDGSSFYRIDVQGALYIANFKTERQPETYTVEVWQASTDYLVGAFSFETVR